MRARSLARRVLALVLGATLLSLVLGGGACHCKNASNRVGAATGLVVTMLVGNAVAGQTSYFGQVGTSVTCTATYFDPVLLVNTDPDVTDAALGFNVTATSFAPDGSNAPLTVSRSNVGIYIAVAPLTEQGTYTIKFAATVSGNPLTIQGTAITGPNPPQPLPTSWYFVTSANSPFQATAANPRVGVDGRTGPVTLSPWATPADNDTFSLKDWYNLAGTTAPITVNSAVPLENPAKPGVFANSVVLSTPGFAGSWSYSGLKLAWGFNVASNGLANGSIPIFFSALSTLTPTSTRQSVVLDGYSFIGDGGGGLFVWDAASTTTPDNCTVASVTGIATGRWKRAYSGPLQAPWCGASGNASDQTASIGFAISFAIAQRSIVDFPPLPNGGTAVYAYSTPLNLSSTTSLRLRGAGAPTGGAPTGTELRYTGSGSASAINASLSVGLVIERLALTATNAGFTGILLDLSGPTSTNSFYGRFDNDLLVSTSNNGTLLNLNNSFGHSFYTVSFGHGFEQVYGADNRASAGFANDISFHDCTFGGQVYSSIHNAGQTWLFDSCNFEPDSSGAPHALFNDNINSSGVSASEALAGQTVTLTNLAGLTPDVAGLTITGFANGGNNGTFTKMVNALKYISATSVSYTNAGASLPDANNGSGHWTIDHSTFNGLRFDACTFGDATQPGTWISAGGSGFSMNSSYMAVATQTGTTGISFNNTTTGVSITGNQLSNLAAGISWGTGSQDVLAFGNSFVNLGSIYNLTSPIIGGIIQSVSNNGAFAVGGGLQVYTPYRARAYLSGAQSLSGGSNTKVQLNTVSGLSPSAGNGQGYDSNLNFDNVTNFWYTAPVSGFYEVSGMIQTAQTSSTLQATIGITLSAGGTTSNNSKGTNAVGTADALTASYVSDILFLNAGDHVALYGFEPTLSPSIGVAWLAVHYLST